MKEMDFQQKPLEKADFNVKLSGLAVVRPASSDKWKAPLGLVWAEILLIFTRAKQMGVEAKEREMFFICSFHFFMSEMFINVSRSSKFY